MKKEVIIKWSIFEDEGYWYFVMGSKTEAPARSGKYMTQAQAKKALDQEIENAKRKYGSETEVVVEELKLG